MTLSLFLFSNIITSFNVLAANEKELPFRQMEQLNRALVAVATENGNYIGWKMLGTDPEDVSFDIYRDDEKINEEPITTSTNFLDEDGTIDSTYQVKVNNGSGDQLTEVVEVWSEQYLSIPLDKPADGVTPDGETYTYRANDASVGDLTGDGNYEIILKWDPSNAKDNSQSGYTGNVYIDAYTLEGELLWRIDLGKNIRAGAHYTQFLVYDFDGDGKAELVMKTADGTVDGNGNVIGDPDADYRNSGGYVLEGSEFLTVFNGETGAAMETIDYNPPRGNVNDWGDGYGNRVDRFLAGVAYLDGERPSFVMARGYYTRTVLAAYNWRDGKITEEWVFDSNEPGNEEFAGQGNHSLSVADVDGDGKDEIIYGASVIDHDGTGLYSTGWGHGDANHVSNLNPNRPGMEIYETYEDSSSPYGYAIRDAETGEVLWGVHTGTDVGRGMAADIDPRYEGAELWASDSWDGSAGGSGLFTVEGELITEKTPKSINHAIWWDGDLLRELLDHDFNENTDPHGVGKIEKWNWETEELETLLVPEGTRSNNHTKGNPSLQADIFGDWREEVIWPTSDSTELRIYTTTDVTEHRIYTLMHDLVYRLGVAWQNVAYNQPPHTSFFLGHGMDKPPVPKIVTEPFESSTGSVSGWVDNGGGKQISNATVSVTVESKEYTATTNDHGFYSIQGIPYAGNIIVSTFKDGCEAGTESINIDGAIFQNVSMYCPITSIEFDQTETNLLLDETEKLNVTILPDDASLNQVEWASSDSNIATVDETGLITASSLGKTTITASSKDDTSISATNKVTVTGIQVEELILDKSELHLKIGAVKQVNTFVVPSNAYNKNILWKSADPQVATVDEQGSITGVSLGTVTITAATEDGGLTESVTVTVQDEEVSVTGVELDHDAYYFSSDHFSELNPDDNEPIKRVIANVLPVDATNNDVVWSTSDTNIAEVDQFGRITAKKSGSADITATTADGQFEATVMVHVPVISESFDNRNIGDKWGSGTGTAGGSGNLGGTVEEITGNHVFKVSGGGSGVRSTQKKLSEPIIAENVLLDFDWNVGSPSTNSDGAQLSIEDSNGNRYLTFQYKNNQELEYGTGGTASNTAIEGVPIGSGFDVNEALYHIQVALDFENRTIHLQATNKENPDISSTIANIPFASETEYNDNVGKIQFVLVRPTGATTSWTTWIDSFNIFALSNHQELELNKSELENKLAEAQAITNEDGLYTDDSFEALQQAINLTKSVLETATSQEMIDEAVVALQNAIDGLVELEVSYDHLITLTTEFITDNGGNKGNINAFVSKLEAAKASEERGNMNARNGQLGAYENQVNAKKGKLFTEEQAEILFQYVNKLKEYEF